MNTLVFLGKNQTTEKALAALDLWPGDTVAVFPHPASDEKDTGWKVGRDGKVRPDKGDS